MQGIKVGDLVKLSWSSCKDCPACEEASSGFFEVEAVHGDTVETEVGDFTGCRWEILPSSLENE